MPVTTFRDDPPTTFPLRPGVSGLCQTAVVLLTYAITSSALSSSICVPGIHPQLGVQASNSRRFLQKHRERRGKRLVVVLAEYWYTNDCSTCDDSLSSAQQQEAEFSRQCRAQATMCSSRSPSPQVRAVRPGLQPARQHLGKRRSFDATSQFQRKSSARGCGRINQPDWNRTTILGRCASSDP